MGWFVTYVIIGVLIIAIGVIAMCFYFSEEGEPDTFVEGLRIVSLFTAGSWAAAILWPVLLLSVVPVLCIYGTWTAFRAAKHKNVSYGLKANE